MKASDRGRNVKSKLLFGCFDEILLVRLIQPNETFLSNIKSCRKVANVSQYGKPDSQYSEQWTAEHRANIRLESSDYSPKRVEYRSAKHGHVDKWHSNNIVTLHRHSLQLAAVTSVWMRAASVVTTGPSCHPTSAAAIYSTH